jgi:(R)-2-hydroxyacyl-CoA dehydratese activating ATPase
MRAAGIDIGSRTVKVAVMENGRLAAHRVAYNSHDPIEVCRGLLDGIAYDALFATGYGRHLFKQYWPCTLVTEIKAVAVGSRFFAPVVRAVLDVGGQDTKAVALDARGAVAKFEMNDKCAAGTGRFLEIMATALAYSMEDFAGAASQSAAEQKVSPMCTVFAESEVVSLVARGVPRDGLAAGLHRTVAQRVAAMLRRVPVEGDVVFCGGVALNACLRRLIEQELGFRLVVPDQPQLIAAVGGALLAAASNGQTAG